MSLNVHTSNGIYSFDGPHTNTGSLKQESGVYVISTKNGDNHRVIDAGEAGDIKARLSNHDRKESWQNHIVDTLYASAYYCDEASRMALEKLVRDYHNPPCGVRTG